MARRLRWCGIEVKAVIEIMPQPSGLPRNIAQCLDDFGIPLYLEHAVTNIGGAKRVEYVDVAPLADGIPDASKTFRIQCDTLLFSVGLVPENELSRQLGVELNPATGGARVDSGFQTSVPGVFAGGNVLHVHDLVDFVSMESEALARHAAAYVEGKGIDPCTLDVKCGEGVGHTIPQKVSGKNDFSLSLRVRNHYRDCRIVVRQNGVEVAAKKMKKAIPAEMIQFKVSAAKLQEEGALEVSVE